jgi:hypothetical protein
VEGKMGLSFRHEANILDFGPRRPKGYSKVISRECILWPAYSFRIVAPLQTRNNLNLFQKAVLGFCRIGITRPEDIGEKLSIDSDLVKAITLELIHLNLLDLSGSPTEEGIKALLDGIMDLHEMVSGYVFQNPWNNELWPRFVKRLEYAEVEYDEKGFPLLIEGGKGNPKKRSPFMVIPNNVENYITPTSAQIVKAVHRHHSAVRRKGDGDVEDLGVFEKMSSWEIPDLKRVSFVENAPCPVYVKTHLLLTEDDYGNTEWYACDPFGFGFNPRFRTWIEEVMNLNPNLFNVVDRLVGRGIFKGVDEQKLWFEDLRKKAILNVEQVLSSEIKVHPAFESIVDMEFQKQEIEYLEDACPKTRVDGVLRTCSKTLEAFFCAISKQYPLKDIWKRVYTNKYIYKTGRDRLVPLKDKKLTESIFRSSFLAVGFEEPIPSSFLSVTPGHIKSVAEHEDSWRLRPLFVATVLLAEKSEDHPLLTAACKNPLLPQLIDDIADKGGKGGHANAGPFSFEDVQSTVDKTYQVISALMG